MNIDSETAEALVEFANAPPPPPSPHKFVRIRFIKDTPMNLDHVVRGHHGRLQPLKGDDPDRKGRVQFGFPAGTEIELIDHVASGNAEIVDQPITPVVPS